MRATPKNPDILFFGTGGPFARSALSVLLSSRVHVVGVVLPRDAGPAWQAHAPPRPPASDIPLQRSFVMQGVAESAWERGIPVFSLGGDYEQFDALTYESVRALNASVIMVACWPSRLPGWLLKIPDWGGLNIHPSRLPYFRGPVPLFWQRRAGLENGAVTIHTLTAELDRGAIQAQADMPFPDGATMDDLDRLTGTMGGELAAKLVLDFAAGLAQPAPQPQGGSYQSFPGTEDFTVPTTWTARHAWNFMRAAEAFGTPFTILVGDRTFVARRAVAYRPGVHNHEPLLDTPGGLAVQFTNGVVVVK